MPVACKEAAAVPRLGGSPANRRACPLSSVTCHLSPPQGHEVDERTREDIEAVRRVHGDACPVYRSVHPQVHVTTAVEFA